MTQNKSFLKYIREISSFEQKIISARNGLKTSDVKVT